MSFPSKPVCSASTTFVWYSFIINSTSAVQLVGWIKLYFSVIVHNVLTVLLLSATISFTNNSFLSISYILLLSRFSINFFYLLDKKFKMRKILTYIPWNIMAPNSRYPTTNTQMPTLLNTQAMKTRKPFLIERMKGFLLDSWYELTLVLLETILKLSLIRRYI